jgi:transposase
MDVYTGTPISRIEIVERGGRRRFSDEAKLDGSKNLASIGVS